MNTSDPQAERLTSFRTFTKAAEARAPIPPVDEPDLKALHGLCVERAKRHCGKEGVIKLRINRVSPLADSQFIPSLVTSLTTANSLSARPVSRCQQGTILDDAVFHPAAQIPMTGTQLDQQDFLDPLRAPKM